SAPGVSEKRGERMTCKVRNSLAVLALIAEWVVTATVHTTPARAADGHYELVENWVQFPAGIAKWGSATGVDVDAQDNVYVFHRNESMPIVAFDRHGNFLRGWGEGMFQTTH